MCVCVWQRRALSCRLQVASCKLCKLESCELRPDDKEQQKEEKETRRAEEEQLLAVGAHCSAALFSLQLGVYGVKMFESRDQLNCLLPHTLSGARQAADWPPDRLWRVTHSKDWGKSAAGQPKWPLERRTSGRRWAPTLKAGQQQSHGDKAAPLGFP